MQRVCLRLSAANDSWVVSPRRAKRSGSAEIDEVVEELVCMHLRNSSQQPTSTRRLSQQELFNGCSLADPWLCRFNARWRQQTTHGSSLPAELSVRVARGAQENTSWNWSRSWLSALWVRPAQVEGQMVEQQQCVAHWQTVTKMSPARRLDHPLDRAQDRLRCRIVDKVSSRSIKMFCSPCLHCLVVLAVELVLLQSSHLLGW